MDSNKFREAYEKLEDLDERFTYKIRARSTGHLSVDQLEERHKDLADYTIRLKEILQDLFQAIAGKSTPATDSQH